MRVKLVQEMSSYRADGTRWPDPGTIMEVSDGEGAELCRSDSHNATPIAIPVVEERTEKAVPKSAPAEVRAEEPDVEPAEPAAEPDAEPSEQPVKRGPGRPRRNG